MKDPVWTMGLEQRAHERPTGLLNPLIVCADDREQLDQVLTHGVALVPFARANEIDQTYEGVLNMATLNVQIGHQHLGGDVGRCLHQGAGAEPC